MRYFKFLVIVILILGSIKNSLAQFRIVISTDFPPIDVCMSGCPADHTSDPDDVQSMVRFLLYANEFDVEGIVASSATFANNARKENLLDLWKIYDEVDENLRKHDIRFPSATYLQSITFQGSSGTWGKSVSNNVGKDKNSEASDAIIKIIDKPDVRPVWFCVWGDCSNIAQAIWKVKQTRSKSELNRFLKKIHIYQVAKQDDTIEWLMNNFPDLFIIYNINTYQGIFGGPNDPLGNEQWIEKNIRQHRGPLGYVYPLAAIAVNGMKEGDSPSFMYLASAALKRKNADDPSQESWGGQFVRLGKTNHWIDGVGASSVTKWKAEYQQDFAKRATWMLP